MNGKKLSKEDIRFIDTYLKNSEIEFVDIRMEMVDHVASAVNAKMQAENLSFYNAFKAYMIANKKELQRSNRKFIKTTDKKVLRRLASHLLKPDSFALFAIAFALGRLSLHYFDAYIVDVIRFSPIGIVFGTCIFFAYISYKNKKQRYSGLERMGLLFVFYPQIQQIFLNPFGGEMFFENNKEIMVVSVAIIWVVALAFIRTAWDFKKKYTDYYKKFVQLIDY